MCQAIQYMHACLEHSKVMRWRKKVQLFFPPCFWRTLVVKSVKVPLPQQPGAVYVKWQNPYRHPWRRRTTLLQYITLSWIDLPNASVYLFCIFLVKVCKQPHIYRYTPNSHQFDNRLYLKIPAPLVCFAFCRQICTEYPFSKPLNYCNWNSDCKTQVNQNRSSFKFMSPLNHTFNFCDAKAHRHNIVTHKYE